MQVSQYCFIGGQTTQIKNKQRKKRLLGSWIAAISNVEFCSEIQKASNGIAWDSTTNHIHLQRDETKSQLLAARQAYKEDK